jgi:ABC-type lipoprotein release transport system permease subunit
MIFIIMDIMDYMRFLPLFVDIYHIKIYNKFNKKNIKQRIKHLYVLINDWWTYNNCQIYWNVVLSMI